MKKDDIIQAYQALVATSGLQAKDLVIVGDAARVVRGGQKETPQVNVFVYKDHFDQLVNRGVNGTVTHGKDNLRVLDVNDKVRVFESLLLLSHINLPFEELFGCAVATMRGQLMYKIHQASKGKAMYTPHEEAIDPSL